MEPKPVPVVVAVWEQYRDTFLQTVAAMLKDLDDWKEKAERDGKFVGGTVTAHTIRKERLQNLVDYENATLALVEAMEAANDSLRSQIRRAKDDVREEMRREARQEFAAAAAWFGRKSAAERAEGEKIRLATLLRAIHTWPDEHMDTHGNILIRPDFNVPENGKIDPQ